MITTMKATIDGEEIELYASAMKNKASGRIYIVTHRGKAFNDKIVITTTGVIAASSITPSEWEPVEVTLTINTIMK